MKFKICIILIFLIIYGNLQKARKDMNKTEETIEDFINNPKNKPSIKSVINSTNRINSIDPRGDMPTPPPLQMDSKMQDLLAQMLSSNTILLPSSNQSSSASGSTENSTSSQASGSGRNLKIDYELYNRFLMHPFQGPIAQKSDTSNSASKGVSP